MLYTRLRPADGRALPTFVCRTRTPPTKAPPPPSPCRDVNDSEDDARRLLHLTRDIRCKVNLLAFNAHEGTPFLPSTQQQIRAFRSVLIQVGAGGWVWGGG